MSSTPKGENMIYIVTSSPRRIEILRRVGIPFEIVKQGSDEPAYRGEDPAEYVKSVALKKIEKLSLPGITAGFDTAVLVDGKILGKPVDEKDAFSMLSRLSGRWHRVLTGFAIKNEHRTITDCEATDVLFSDLSADEITAYISTGEPFDKAGAYGIQEKGMLLVKRINGCFYNVMGLPVERFSVSLERFGISRRSLLGGVYEETG